MPHFLCYNQNKVTQARIQFEVEKGWISMARKIDIGEITRCFMGGLDCSQVVFAYGGEMMDFDEEEAMRIAAAFGGGLFQGKTCGCVTGALMALGLKYGHCELGDEEAKATMLAKKAAFEQKFAEENGSLICRELVGYDFSKEGELKQAMNEGILLDLCPKLALSACKIIAEMIEEDD